MKFYIPTSSLNFDNILSSESIAPEIFYQERNYGYKSFEVVENINYQNSIVLITKMPKFLIHDTKRENYPMIIEVDIPETSFNSYGINMLQCVHEFDIYTANQTIHINPEICKIFFFDSKSLSSVKLKLSDSLTIKMGKFYHIGIAPKEIQFEWKNTYLPEEKNNQTQLDISEFIAKDDNINRVKGFLFAYVGGVLHSIPNDIAKMRKVCREIYNIISSILNDSSRIPNNFIESLNVLKNEFDKLDQDKNKLREIYNNLFLYTPDTKRIVDYFGENLIKKLICEKERITPYSFPKFSNNLSIEEWEKINFEILKFEKKDSPIYTPQQVKGSIVNISIKENKLAKFDIRSIDEEQKNLYIDLLNNCFLHKDGISIDSVRIDKKKLGDDIAKKIKSHVGEREWEYSHKSYFTALRQNIANATPFDVTSSNSIIEQSIAAFLLKGENLSNLQKYLENNGIGDVSLAYGFWGASIGFANMPKTLTNELFLSDSIEYTSEIYKYIFKQVHGIDLKGKFERKQEKESAIIIPSKLNEQQTESIVHVVTNVTLLEQELLEFEAFTSKDKIVRSEIVTKLTEVGIYSLSNWDDKKVGSIKWATSKGQKKIVAAIKKTMTKPKTKSKAKSGFSQNQGFLFKCNTTGVFLNDLEFLLSNEDFINIVSKRKDWKKDLKWFIESHDKFHKDYERYWKGKPTDNESIIKQFIFFKKEEYKDCEVLLRKLYL